jgi:hypothetical protein
VEYLYKEPKDNTIAALRKTDVLTLVYQSKQGISEEQLCWLMMLRA